jgi:hypothetical protein
MYRERREQEKDVKLGEKQGQGKKDNVQDLTNKLQTESRTAFLGQRLELRYRDKKEHGHDAQSDKKKKKIKGNEKMKGT